MPFGSATGGFFTYIHSELAGITSEEYAGKQKKYVTAYILLFILNISLLRVVCINVHSLTVTGETLHSKTIITTKS